MSGEFDDIVIGDLPRVYAGLDRGILCRQTISIEADRKQHVVALHAAFPADNFQTRICLDVSDMHAVTGGIRELYQCVELRLGVILARTERAVLFPILLPLWFDRGKIIFVAHVFIIPLNIIYLPKNALTFFSNTSTAAAPRSSSPSSR